LTSDGELNSTPAWSPDGTQIAFERKSGSTYHIWIMDAGWNNQQQLTSDGKRNLRPAWSPDGSEIVYTSDRDGVEAVWIIPIDGSKAPRRLSPGNGFDAAWSRY
jgi:TolB protein